MIQEVKGRIIKVGSRFHLAPTEAKAEPIELVNSSGTHTYASIEQAFELGSECVFSVGFGTLNRCGLIHLVKPVLPPRRCGNCSYFAQLGSGSICNAFHTPDAAGRVDRADCVDWEDKNAAETVKPLKLEVRREAREQQRDDAMVRSGELIARNRLRIVSTPHHEESLRGQSATWLSMDEMERPNNYWRGHAEGHFTTPLRDPSAEQFRNLRETITDLDDGFRQRYCFQEGVTASQLLWAASRENPLDWSRESARFALATPLPMRLVSENSLFAGTCSTITLDRLRVSSGSCAWGYRGTVLFFPPDPRRAPLHRLPREMPERWHPPTYPHDVTATELLVLSLGLPPIERSSDAAYLEERPFAANLRHPHPLMIRFGVVEMNGHRLWSCTGRILCE